MTVQDLIIKLQAFPPTANVVIYVVYDGHSDVTRVFQLQHGAHKGQIKISAEPLLGDGRSLK